MGYWDLEKSVRFMSVGSFGWIISALEFVVGGGGSIVICRSIDQCTSKDEAGIIDGSSHRNQLLVCLLKNECHAMRDARCFLKALTTSKKTFSTLIQSSADTSAKSHPRSFARALPS